MVELAKIILYNWKMCVVNPQIKQVRRKNPFPTPPKFDSNNLR